MESEWLVGASGLYRGTPQTGWSQIGAAAYPVNAILSRESDVIVGTEGGLWCVQGDRWIQWHDETMTLVLDLAVADSGVGVAVASAYGVATGALDDNNVPRWQWHSDALKVNARFSNAIVNAPQNADRLLVGTEAGIWIYEGKQWTQSSLGDRPVRALIWAQDAFWAGADHGGVWKSQDGFDWQKVGDGLDDVPVYDLKWADDRLIAGTENGIAVSDGTGRWGFNGPTVRARVLGISESYWLAGTSPGGLWFSEDLGQTWHRTGQMHYVQTIVSAEGA